MRQSTPLFQDWLLDPCGSRRGRLGRRRRGRRLLSHAATLSRRFPVTSRKYQVLLSELAGAFTLLTRLPMPSGLGALAPMAHCVWAFPLVGAVVGGIAGGVYAIATSLGIPPGLAACWAVAVSLAVTGALHEDGLADTSDGFGGGRTPERKLEIMRDSRIGTYGALALMLSLAVRVSAMAALARPGTVLAALVVAGALGRGTILGLLILLRPARPDGLAAGLGAVPPGATAAGLATALAAAFLVRPDAAMGAVLLAGLTCAGIAALARLQVGGYTGDVLGAGCVATECAVLTMVAAVG